MKNLKKAPSNHLEKFSNVFMQLGLVLVLFVVYISLEHQTEQKTSISCFFPLEREIVYVPEEIDFVFIKEPKPILKIEMPKQDPFIIDEVEKGDNDIVENTIIDSPEEVHVMINEGDIIEVVFKEKIIENVPYAFIQDAPVFKGCEGLNKKENKVCFDKKMKQFVQRNFDIGLANELGLRSGKHKILTQFIINDKGDVIDILVRTPSKGLEKEAERIIKKLPKFKPGKQNNKNVKVRYSLPISFSIN